MGGILINQYQVHTDITLTVSTYSSSTCLIVLVLITLFDHGGTTKHLSPKQANTMNVILLLEIFTRTYTDIYKYWNYLLMFLPRCM